MIHGPSNHTLGATGSCVICAAAAALALLVYAAVTFAALLEAAPVRDFLP